MAACAVFSFASAQETGFGFGVKAGVNISNQTLDDAAKYKAGFTGGIFADYRTCNWFAVSVDVLYSRQGSKIENSDIKLRTDYLNIPVLANFYLTRGMALKTGVQPGFLLAAKAKEGDVKVDAKNIYKTPRMMLTAESKIELFSSMLKTKNAVCDRSAKSPNSHFFITFLQST